MMYAMASMSWTGGPRVKPNSDAYVLAKNVSVELSILLRSLGPACGTNDRSDVVAIGEAAGDWVGEMGLNAALDCLRDDGERALPERSRS